MNDWRKEMMDGRPGRLSVHVAFEFDLGVEDHDEERAALHVLPRPLDLKETFQVVDSPPSKSDSPVNSSHVVR